MLKLKRVYDAKEPDDGTRVLVDRLWPRGLTKETAEFDEWMKDIAPSNELRKWFAHEPDKWMEFNKRYLQELSISDKVLLLERLDNIAQSKDVTLLYAAKDTEHNNAAALKEIIENRLSNRK